MTVSGDGHVVMVVPCYNESDRWNPTYWGEMVDLPGTQWYFVDDGSTDGTLESLRGLQRDHPVSVLVLPRNSGKAEAVRNGMLACLDENPPPLLVGFIDADGAFTPEDVRRLINTARGGEWRSSYDALWAARVALRGREIKRRASRHYVGRLIATGLGILISDMPYDTQAGFKVFRATPELHRSLAQPFQTRWLFEIELLLRFRQGAGRDLAIWEEPLGSWREIQGSHIRGREVIRIGRELAAVALLSRKAPKPGVGSWT